MDKKTQVHVWYWLIAGVGILLLQLWVANARVETIAYSEFQRYLEEGSFEEISIGEQQIRGVLGEPSVEGGKYIVATRVDPVLARELPEYDVEFTGVVESQG